MPGRRSGERSSRGLEFNIHLYLRLNYGTAPKHLKYSVRTLYDVFVASVGLNNNTEYYKLKSTGPDLNRVSSDRYPIRRKWLDRSRYRSSVSDRCIPNIYLYISYKTYAMGKIFWEHKQSVKALTKFQVIPCFHDKIVYFPQQLTFFKCISLYTGIYKYT